MKNTAIPLLNKAASHPLKNYIYEELEALNKKINKLETTGLELDNEDVLNLSKYFFQAGNGSYIGIESNLPSTYFELYPTYLQENERYLKTLTLEERAGTKRILIARSGGEIRTDASMHPQLYKDFIEWHSKNKVELYWIESDKAEQIMNMCKTESTDLAYWNSAYAVEFKTNSEKNM